MIMAFSDLFSADNFAKLNAGIGNVTGTPLGQLGVQMLANSGYRADNAGMGERLGAALQGMSTMQQAQALQQYRRDQIANEQARQHQLQAAWDAKQQQAQRYQAALQDPTFLAQLSPTARQFAALGIDPGELLRATSQDQSQARFEASQALQQQRTAQQQAQFEERMAHMGQGGDPKQPKVPTPSQIIVEPLTNGKFQKHIFNPATGGYDKYGAPYSHKADPLDALVNEVAPDPTAASSTPAPATPPNPALPGNAPLQSYRPQPTSPTPLVAAGAVPQRQPNPNSVEALAQAPASNAQQYPNAPAVGAIVKGHRYNGGNPASAASWSKI
jgi:hypothetical protein